MREFDHDTPAELETPLWITPELAVPALAWASATLWLASIASPGVLVTLLSLAASAAALAGALAVRRDSADRTLRAAVVDLTRRLEEQTEALAASNLALRRQVALRRAAEDTCTDLFANSDDMVFTLDSDGAFTTVNRAGEHLIGVRGAALAGVALTDTVAASDRLAVSRALLGVRQGDAPASLVVSLEDGQGRARRVELSLRLAAREGCTAAGITGIARDVTQRERLEAEVRQAHKLDALGQLAGGVAHDFNNILMVIQGYADLLLSRAPEDGRRDDLQQIRAAAQRGSDLTRQLLAFGRRQALRVTALDLHAVVIDTCRMLTRVVGEHIDLRVVRSDARSIVEADRTQLEQVVMNLVTNARDAMPHGGTLTLTVGRASAPDLPADLRRGDFVTLTVADTGTGMDDTTRQRIFDPFFTTKAPGKGSGLGLSTVHGVVKQLGGEIVVDSTPQTGTTFIVYLPASARRPQVSSPSDVDLPEAGTGATILVVEDDAPVREMLTAVLRRHGYVVIAAATPREALLAAARHQGPLDLVLTDVVMPEMTGPEMVALLRNVRPESPVLFVSGHSVETAQHGDDKEQPAPLLRKPVSTRELLEAIRRRLEPRTSGTLRAAS